MNASLRSAAAPLRQWPLGAPAVRDNRVLRYRDCCARARFGCKGPAAPAWLESRGFRVPADANSANLDSRGILVARLATNEFLIEALGVQPTGSGGGAVGAAVVQDGGAENIVAEVARELSLSAAPEGVYPVARQDVVIELSGTSLNWLLRQICSVDFAPLLDGATAASANRVVLTSMIGVSVVAWPSGAAHGPALTLWLDCSFGHYFCSNLLEVGGGIGGPFDGRAG